VAVEGGAAVSFLFPFWTRWTPEAPPRDDIMAHVVGTQLEMDQRLTSLRKLGAAPADTDASEPAAKASLKERMEFIGWSTLAVLLLTACVAFNLLTMLLLLWGVWWMLQFALGSGW
jgi:hypothetical protein